VKHEKFLPYDVQNKASTGPFYGSMGAFCIWGGHPVTEDRAKRKLTAILSADVKGYSRLMGEDERATVETLKTYRDVMGERDL
jgi:class 3 adenylate cyclase